MNLSTHFTIYQSSLSLLFVEHFLLALYKFEACKFSHLFKMYFAYLHWKISRFFGVMSHDCLPRHHAIFHSLTNKNAFPLTLDHLEILNNDA
jgi:hypothetical protein